MTKPTTDEQSFSNSEEEESVMIDPARIPDDRCASRGRCNNTHSNESTTSTTSPDGGGDGERDFSKKESKAINYLRVLVFVILFVAAVAVSFIVFRIARNGEETEFVSKFDAVAEQLTTIFMNVPDEKFGTLGSLSVAYTAQARDTNATFPYVTLTSFQQRASTSRRLSGSFLTAYQPIIDDDDKTAWERYVTQEKDWM
jgi:hypothetical protein